jgi:hypothetical protein
MSTSAPGTDITETPNGEKIWLTMAAAALSSAIAAADGCIETNLGGIMRDCSSAFSYEDTNAPPGTPGVTPE